MYWIAFGRWDHTVGRWFYRERVYWRGYVWTPLVRVARRCRGPCE